MNASTENVSGLPSRLSRGSVLVVEDDMIVAMDMQRSLGRRGYEVVGTTNAAESAIRMCADLRPDVVVMDLVLRSEMDGVDAAAQIRAAFDIPVIFVTGHTSEELLGRAKVTDPYGFIVKPFDETELDCALQLAIQKHDLQRRLREREEQFRSLVENSSDLIAVVDENGEFLYASPSYHRILAYDPAALAGASFFDLVDTRDRARAMVLFAQASRQDDVPMRAELRLMHHDGVAVPCEVVAQGQSDDPSTPGVIVNARDISMRKREQAERQRLEDQLRRLQKMKSLGIMAGGIAHDFNNLLMTILGNAELALEGMAPEADEGDNLREILRAARRASELTDQMLAYSGHGRLMAETIDLSRMVQDFCHAIEVSVPPRVRLVFELDRQLPLIEGDVDQMRTVLMSLITNAAEAIGEDTGEIVVATGTRSAVGAGESFVEDHRPEGPSVYLEVRDDGCGMDEETCQSIFDPFFTTKFMGRGLGLAAVLGIVRGHRGAVQVESFPGRGSAFRVYFPVAVSRSREVLAEPDGVFSTPTWRVVGRVLLVDDEASLRELGRRMLEPVGLEVRTASDGAEGVRLFAEYEGRGEGFSCVILDMTMPLLSGREVFERIRAIRPGVPVIVATGYTREDVEAEFAEEGLAGFLHKPYRSQELLNVIRLVLDSAAGAGFQDV